MNKNAYVIFKNDAIALCKQEHEVYTFITEPQLMGDIDTHFIMTLNEVNYFAAREEDSVLSHLDIIWMPLKQALHVLDINFFQLLATAYQTLYWEQRSQYCGLCGAKTETRNKFEKQCTQCHNLFYPAIAPSIIVMVQREDKILMARSPHFPPGVFGLIAGFVEPGESAEQTIHREVFEEVGITVKNIRYFGSQAWPFPSQLMLAFTADHAAGEIKMDNKEIEAAGWYRAGELPGLPSFKVSIGFAMIESFIGKQ